MTRLWRAGIGLVGALALTTGSAAAAPAPDVTVCPALVVITTVYTGQTFTLDADDQCPPPPAGASVEWEVSSGGGTVVISGASSPTLTVTAGAPGDYSYIPVFITSSGAETGQADPVTVDAVPTVADQLVLPAQSATFTLTGDVIGSVQWQESTDGGMTWSDDTTDSGVTTSTLTVAGVTGSQNGEEFRAAITDGYGTVDTAPATLSVEQPPLAVTQQPMNVSLGCVGATATFTAAASGTPAPTVQWQVSTDGGTTFANDTTDAGAQTDTLTVTVSTAITGNEYRAEFSNSSGSVVSNAATLTVSPPPIVTTQPASEAVDSGGTASFTSAVDLAGCAPSAAVQWEVQTPGSGSFTPIAGATSDTLTIPAVTTADSGNEYEAVFTIGPVTVTTSPATLTVINTPVVTRVTPSRGGPFSIVFIQGTNMSGATAVSFGANHRALFLQLSSSLIVALAPFEPKGTVDVTVTSTNGTSSTSAADQFTYLF